MSMQPEIRTWLAASPRPSRRWAVWLVVVQVVQVLVEFLTLRVAANERGVWVVTTADPVPAAVEVVSLLTGLASLAGTIGFFLSLIRERRFGVGQWPTDRLSGTDVLYLMAWVQALITVLMTGHLFTYPLFPSGSIPGLMETAAMQVFILAAAAFLFRGRWAVIGFVWPERSGRMWGFLLAAVLFIFFAMDWLITHPLADWLNLSLESEREQLIQEELVQARDRDWQTAIFAVLLTGVIVPISEEMLFRGAIQTYLVQRWGAFWGILVTSVWFALIHVDIPLFVPLLLISVLLGFIRHRYQSIWGAVLLHSVNNLAGVLPHFFQ